jgi:hypothetical protein
VVKVVKVRGRKILRSFCVIARTNINCGEIIWSLGGVVFEGLIAVND